MLEYSKAFNGLYGIKPIEGYKMNERIKELMVQVCKEQGLPFTVEHNRAYMLDNFSEKFAELIVKECASLVVDDDNAYDILKHFGVEE